MIKHLNLKVDSYGISKFFFYHVPADLEVDYDELDFLTNQKNAGLLPLTLLKREEELYVRYDQIADITLDKLFSKTLTKEHLTTYLVNLVDSLADLQASGVKIEKILLNKHYIFLDHFSNRLVFMYMPTKSNVFEKVSMKEFFRDLIAATNYDEMGDLSFFIKLHNSMATDDELKLAAFKEWLLGSSTKIETNEGQPSSEDTEEKDANFYSPGGVFTSHMMASEDHGVLTSEYNSRKVDKKKNQKLEIEEELQYKRITRTELGEGESLMKGAPSSLGGTSINIMPNMNPFNAQATMGQEDVGTTVLGAFSHEDLQDEGTTVLGFGNQPASKPFLFSSKLEEKIMIEKDQFKIGRDPKQADYASNNKVIGRVHAEVVNEDGEYFLIDNDSRNGSYVNGMKLLPHEKTKLKHEDRIKLANEEFVFKLF